MQLSHFTFLLTILLHKPKNVVSIINGYLHTTIEPTPQIESYSSNTTISNYVSEI